MVTRNFLPPLVEWGVFAVAVALLTGSTAGNKRGPTVAVGVLLACAFLCGIVLAVTVPINDYGNPRLVVIDKARFTLDALGKHRRNPGLASAQESVQLMAGLAVFLPRAAYRANKSVTIMSLLNAPLDAAETASAQLVAAATAFQRDPWNRSVDSAIYDAVLNCVQAAAGAPLVNLPAHVVDAAARAWLLRNERNRRLLTIWLPVAALIVLGCALGLAEAHVEQSALARCLAIAKFAPLAYPSYRVCRWLWGRLRGEPSVGLGKSLDDLAVRGAPPR